MGRAKQRAPVQRKPAAQQPTRSASTASAPQRAPAPAPQRAVARAPAPAAAPAVQQSAGPGLMGTMASSMAGSVAGSVIGHGISRAMFGAPNYGGNDHAIQETNDAPVSTDGYTNNDSSFAMSNNQPCFDQLQRYQQCLKLSNGDMSSCEMFFQKLSECKMTSDTSGFGSSNNGFRSGL